MGTTLLVLICGLALYGLILLLLQLGRLLCRRAAVKPYLSLLFVVRDQASVIEGLVREIVTFYHTSRSHFDLVIVDDGSADETPEILKRLNKNSAFTFIECDRPAEQPLEIGLRACRGEVICYVNLNGQINPRLVSRLVRRLLNGEEILAPLEHCAVTLVRRKSSDP